MAEQHHQTTSERLRRYRAALSEHFVRNSGPGGQNVNKVSTAVELRFHVDRTDLADRVKARLRELAGSRLTGDGDVLIEAREHRTQALNREAARERLLDLIARASRIPRKRRATRPPAVAKERRIVTKQRRGSLKRTRAKAASSDD